MNINKLLVFVMYLMCQIGVAQSDIDNIKSIELGNIQALKTTKIPAKTTLQLNFSLKNSFSKDTAFVLELDRVEFAQLFERLNGSSILIGKAGARVPIMERSVPKDGYAIQFNLKSNETRFYSLSIGNYQQNYSLISPILKPHLQYQLDFNSKKESLANKYLIPGFFILLVVILILTIFQYIVLPEKHFIYYFLYLFFLLIRSASADERLLLEKVAPLFNKIGYSSTDSQLFVYISFIFYLLFLNAFTGLQAKKPRLYIFYKIEIVYLLLFIVFDLIFPTQKFTNPNIYSIFRAMETFGVLIGLLNIIILLKVYDNFNKYVVIGAFSLFLFAIVGQEIVKRFLDENSDRNLYTNSLTLVWAIAYIIEISFFTIALISRQRALLATLENEKKQILNLTNETEIQNSTIEKTPNVSTPDFEYFSLATNKGVLVFQQTEIIRLEASGNYTIFSIQNDRQTLGSYTLADFENKLNPSQFLRVHKSHLVNLKYVVKYTKGDGGTLTLQDGSEIPVSRSRKEELLKRLHTT